MTKSSSLISFSTSLLLDAMYYHAARSCYLTAKNALAGIRRTKQGFLDLRNKEDLIKRTNENSDKSYNKLEQIYIQMESAEHNIGSSYGPYLQNIALTHILCTTAAEAHINVIARKKFKGKFMDHFERISLEGKWLFLPKIVGNSSFDPGSEQFQNFSKLIKYRNELVHYKGQKEKWDGFEYGEPQFFNKLGLTIGEARKSLKTIKIMFLEIAKMTNIDPPFWIRKGYDDLPQEIATNFFSIEVEK